MKVELKFDRATKGTLVFKSEDPNAAITSVYINKAAFKDAEKPPAKITLSSDEVK